MEQTNTELIPVPDEGEGGKKPFSFGSLKVKLLAAGVFLAVLAVLLTVTAFSVIKGCDKPLKYYFSAVEKADGEKLVKSLPDCAVLSIEYSSAVIGYDSAAEFYEKELLSDTLKELKEDLGSRIRISYTVDDRRELSSEECAELSRSMNAAFGSTVEAEKAYELNVTYTIKGSDDSRSESCAVTVCKIGGRWSFAGIPDIIL